MTNKVQGTADARKYWVPVAARGEAHSVWEVLHTAMTTDGAARRLALLILMPLVAMVAMVALVVIFLGPIGAGALVPLLGGAGFALKRFKSSRPSSQS